MNAAQVPLLSLLIWLPLGGALIVGLLRSIAAARLCALCFAVLELVLAILVFAGFRSEYGDRLQWVEHFTWIGRLHIDYFLGVDGISILLLPLSALLTLMTILATWTSVHHLPRSHLALLLALEGITMGVFSAMDLMLFFLFWELTLPPIFFLIGLWGIGPERRSAATKYTLVMLFGGIALLFGIVLLALSHAETAQLGVPAGLSFSVPDLLDNTLPPNTERVVFILLLIGFAVKAPLPPFHTW
ncbi:MAG: proton-conducting transporter transmembrane domain-containing protein, partial [Gammaproteobacteria bacterium]